MQITSEDILANGIGRTTLKLVLEQQEAVHLLHPKQLIAFQGASSQREDRLLNPKGIMRKKKLVKAVLTGPAAAMIALPAGYSVTSVPIQGDSSLLFEFRHLLYYTDLITMKSVVQSAKNMLITRDLIRMRFAGEGSIGLLSRGPLQTWELDPERPSFIDSRCLIAYPADAKLDLCVYGNHLAAQHMAYHWKLTGTGTALLQAAPSDPGFEEQLGGDGLMKRTLREILPFGNIWIR
ncbi:AIM24 family protein [Paenibacillus koleovorans]|uniref:AIM24 family protein n=1 Tax=Paenibacillus koleovorans TaxID=121608 RepID=UPI000FDCC482|nr:AIM24 family protein [Paenibacillus koleovorans]